MSRNSKHRKRLRKQRRKALKALDQSARAQGLPLPSLFPTGVARERRDPRLRWSGLSARGGIKLGFRPTGVSVPVNFGEPERAECGLHEALALMLSVPPEECETSG